MVTSCFSFQGAAEDPQTALALNLDPALMKKKSDPEGPATLLFPERELSIRIGSAGLLSGKPSAADAELGRREGPDLGLVLGEEEMPDALSSRLLTSLLTAVLCLSVLVHLICSCKRVPIIQAVGRALLLFPTWVNGQGSL